MTDLSGATIHINGIVQGVGFRPFVYSLAKRLNLLGWVRNTSAGVDIEVDGTDEALEAFFHALKNDAPPLAKIDAIQVSKRPADGFSTFEIIHSHPIPDAFQPISPDVSICNDCLRELFDPKDRRFRYPFINCTNCGPRFTIINDIPYDRPNTTMSPFELCSQCAAEYHDPMDRRFHAQPVACGVCGPSVWLELVTGDSYTKSNSHFVGDTQDEIIQITRDLLTSGYIVAIKGLGGFHLACDATNTDAVAKLRERKNRIDKPFALMFPDIETVKKHCFLNRKEEELLSSIERPIVILNRREDSTISKDVAPNQDTLGVFFPYTPLHYLIFEPEEGFPEALVMTSGNLSEEPISKDNQEALDRLSRLADAFLMHNRDIQTRCDDSVLRVVEIPSSKTNSHNSKNSQLETSHLSTYQLRRSRGYSPNPIHILWESPQILATGPELKNAFCLTKNRYAFLSHHIGDMENYETLKSFEDSINHYEKLFRIEPEAIACDLHPNYLATRYALKRAESENLPTIGVQHHHAHITSCMAEHRIPNDHRVIGVSFDGTGYGDDGAIWGGEFLISNYEGYQRVAHLKYVPLPGGDKAIREPWRIALSWLYKLGIDWDVNLYPIIFVKNHKPSSFKKPLEILHTQLEKGINSPNTSSIGRLFDAVSSIIGICQQINYEAQAAIELEAIADPADESSYAFQFDKSNHSGSDCLELNPKPVFHEIINDLKISRRVSSISARFHNGLAAAVCQTCASLRDQFDINEVVLSGGVWQNIYLLRKTLKKLTHLKFDVFIHKQVPANDGGLALGQAAVAYHMLRDEN